jgi:hypothetical protein
MNKQSMTMWCYTKAEVVRRERGSLIDINGQLVSSKEADQIVVNKAVASLIALFKLLGEHDIAICEDSEQGVVAINLNNGFEMVYHNLSRDNARLLRNGFLVGYLVRRIDEAW